MSDHEFETYLTLLCRFLHLTADQREEIADELRDHLEQSVKEFEQSGMSHSQAIHRALDEFGDAASLASSFKKIIKEKRRKKMMRWSAASIITTAMCVIATSLFWPNNPATNQNNTAMADEWRQLKKTTFYSANKAHMLRIEPHPDWPDKIGHCRATLVRGQKKDLWSRHLINNYGPVQVFVSDSGKYVVTMDEWGSVGKFPVVIYGQRGDLIQVHNIETLGLNDDLLHIKMSVSSLWWNEDSISFFGPDEEMFFIRLHWGRWIVLELRSGDLLQKEVEFSSDDYRKEHEQKWKKLEEYRKKKIAEKAIPMLSSNDANDRKTGALISGQEKLKLAVPELRKLLADRAWFTQSGTIMLYVRQAAKDALEAMGEHVGKVITKLPEKGHIKYDKATSRYVLDFDE